MSQLSPGPLAVLQRIRDNRYRPEPTESAADEERCELCSELIAADHGHLVDTKGRNLLCACRGCYLLFESEGAGGQHFRAVPDRYRAFSGSAMTAADWESLQIPVGVAFFFWNSALDRVAGFYPGPAGATESELSLETWTQLVGDHPGLEDMRPDVEAFLVRSGRGGGVVECFLVPIDVCYELVGQLRRLWRGFDGGTEAHEAIDALFERIRARVGS